VAWAAQHRTRLLEAEFKHPLGEAGASLVKQILHIAGRQPKPVDTITDFEAGEAIEVDNAAFAGIGSDGTLKARYFHSGSNAHDGNNRFVYQKAKGKLFYDPDGDGDDGKVLFARVDPGTYLDHSDFLVI
jgi:hypothetical protein